MQALERFQKTYDEAVLTIQKFCAPGDSQPQMHLLTQWMLTTDANPYSYLQDSWGECLSTAEGFAGLLQNISHALYDNGDISFVTVNGEPRIVFAHPSDEGFRRAVLSSQEQRIEADKFLNKYRASMYDIAVLDINPNEFGVAYDTYFKEQIRRWYVAEAAADNIANPQAHYSKYQLWDPSWIEGCREEIAILRNQRNETRKHKLHTVR